MRGQQATDGRQPRTQFLFVSRFAVGALVAMLAAGAAYGQDGNRIFQEELRVKMDEQQPGAQERAVEGGGWLSYLFEHYNSSGDHKWRTLHRYEVHPWMGVNLQNVHQFYVRGFFDWQDWHEGGAPTGGKQWNFDPYVERLWYRFDSAAIYKNQTGKRPDSSISVKVGREFATIGTALTLAIPLDMVQVEATIPDWKFMALGGRTNTLSKNLDQSSFVQQVQRRDIFGFQATYTGLQRHQPFVYYLNNYDEGSKTYDSATNLVDQAYQYSSQYLGAGSTGNLVLPNLRYQTELVGEWGKTYGDGPSDRDPICALAYDALVQYLFQCPTHPQVTGEYLYGSGDQSHVATAAGTVGGNVPGTHDRDFNAFGFRDTGIAFSPRLSNIQIFTLGGSFFPLEKSEWFRKMEWGAKTFLYVRSTDGPISDSTASNVGQGFLGHEWDVYMNWRVTSDLSWTVRYGIFFPSSAFPDDAHRQFLFTGVVFSF